MNQKQELLQLFMPDIEIDARSHVVAGQWIGMVSFGLVLFSVVIIPFVEMANGKQPNWVIIGLMSALFTLLGVSMFAFNWLKYRQEKGHNSSKLVKHIESELNEIVWVYSVEVEAYDLNVYRSSGSMMNFVDQRGKKFGLFIDEDHKEQAYELIKMINSNIEVGFTSERQQKFLK